MRTAFYPGTFDPVTNGHVDILRGAVALAERTIVGIGVNPAKSPLFTLAERETMLRQVIGSLGRKDAARVTIMPFEGLTVDAARKAGASILVRGLRDGNDFEYEMQMAGVNNALFPELQTVFIPASPTARHITATLVRQVAGMGGDVSTFVPEAVGKQLRKKFAS
jgi:pantetheine-phosphate adenylyltransferase